MMTRAIDTAGDRGRRKPAGCLSNERGIALILAIVMLMLLTIVGIFALETSNTELRIAGNYRTYEVAFYAADAGVANMMTNGAIYTSIPMASTTWNNTITIGDAADSASATMDVEWLYKGKIIPPKVAAVSDADADKYTINHFRGMVTGNGPNNASVNIQSMYLRLY